MAPEQYLRRKGTLQPEKQQARGVPSSLQLTVGCTGREADLLNVAYESLCEVGALPESGHRRRPLEADVPDLGNGWIADALRLSCEYAEDRFRISSCQHFGASDRLGLGDRSRGGGGHGASSLCEVAVVAELTCGRTQLRHHRFGGELRPPRDGLVVQALSRKARNGWRLGNGDERPSRSGDVVGTIAARSPPDAGRTLCQTHRLFQIHLIHRVSWPSR